MGFIQLFSFKPGPSCPTLLQIILFASSLAFCVPLFAVSGNAPTPLHSWQYASSDLSQQANLTTTDIQHELKALNWQNTEKPQNLPQTNNKPVLWLKTTLPSSNASEPNLFIPPLYMYLNVYLDDELIYNFYGHNKARSYLWHLINLPEDFTGKTLLLRIESDYTKIGLSNDVMIGSRSALIENMIKRDADRIVIGLLLAMVGILALAFSPRRKETVAYIAFGANTLCVASWIIFYTYSKELVFPNTTFWFYVWLVSMLGMLPTFILYIEKIYGSGYKNALTYVRRFYVIIMTVNLGIYWVWGESTLVYINLNIARSLFVVAILLTVHQVSLQYYRGQKDAGIFLLGFATLMFFVFHDAGLALGLINDGRTMSHWGELILIIIMASILGFRFNDMYLQLDAYSKKLESTARERELMVQDLHDGLGGMATNISLLADVAKRQTDSVQVKNTLATISDLSRESVTEIRGFMKSLDNSSADWSSFSADLRQYGSNILEPHDINFSLFVDIDPNTEQPNNVLRLNLLRIYKEALVNIVKHAQASRVVTRLSATAEQFKMTIHDDGTGLNTNSDHDNTDFNGGKGLKNIVSRATEMGGEASIESDQGTMVEVVIPLPIKSPDLGIPSEDRN